MKIATYEWNALMSMFATCKEAELAKSMFEMWLDEKAAEVYKQAWKEFCDEYEIEYEPYDEDDNEDDNFYEE